MKKLEKKMIQAINNKQNFKSVNTRVKIINNCTFVILYNTIIFASVQGKSYFSDGGYKTVTTGSRLRALGAEYSTSEKKNNCILHDQKMMIQLYNKALDLFPKKNYILPNGDKVFCNYLQYLYLKLSHPGLTTQEYKDFKFLSTC